MYMKCDWTDICVRLIGYIIRTAVYLPVCIPLGVLTSIEYFVAGLMTGEPIRKMIRDLWDYYYGGVKEDIGFIRTGKR